MSVVAFRRQSDSYMDTLGWRIAASTSSWREAGFGQRGKLLHFIQGERGRCRGCLDDF
jgi:hypothetical protein